MHDCISHIPPIKGTRNSYWQTRNSYWQLPFKNNSPKNPDPSYGNTRPSVHDTPGAEKKYNRWFRHPMTSQGFLGRFQQLREFSRSTPQNKTFSNKNTYITYSQPNPLLKQQTGFNNRPRKNPPRSRQTLGIEAPELARNGPKLLDEESEADGQVWMDLGTDG